MFPEPQLSNNALVELCHRLAVETDSGIDIRRTWTREAEMTRGRLHPYFASVRDAVIRGDSLTSGLASTGSLFPPLFLEMTHVGEQTGTLSKVFRRLEGHYRHQVQAQRIFLGAIWWPLLELAFAIFIVGLLIWIMGIISSQSGQRVDVLGFGLIGNVGLLIYINFIIAVGLCIAGLVIAIRRGKLWTRPIQHALIRLPVIGDALQKIVLARVAWALHLTLNVAMDLRRLVPLVLRTTGNDYYMRHTDQIVRDVVAGDPLHLAFSRTGAFPADFIDALAVAEESGRTVESMERLSNRYEEEAQSAVKILAVALGFLVTILVMGIIVMLIFRIAGSYFNSINDALKMTR